MNKQKKYVKSLRRFRIFHRYIGITIALLLLISSVTGILLAWKKKSNAIQPGTQKGVSQDIRTWKPMSEIHSLAEVALWETEPDQKGNLIDRMDARPSKGIVKCIFKEGNWEVQIDATTGEVKSIDKRWSDWIESLHDGSIINDLFKFISMNFLGIGLMILLSSGLWLWYGPRLVRRHRNK